MWKIVWQKGKVDKAQHWNIFSQKELRKPSGKHRSPFTFYMVVHIETHHECNVCKSVYI